MAFRERKSSYIPNTIICAALLGSSLSTFTAARSESLTLDAALRTTPAYQSSQRFEQFSRQVSRVRNDLTTPKGDAMRPPSPTQARNRLNTLLKSMGDEGLIDDQLRAIYLTIPTSDSKSRDDSPYSEQRAELAIVQDELITIRNTYSAQVPQEMLQRQEQLKWANILSGIGFILTGALAGSIWERYHSRKHNYL